MGNLYVLDACSLIAFLKREQGGEIVAENFSNVLSGQCIIYLHRVTLAEVVYDLLRSGTFANADAIFSVCHTLPITFNDDLTNGFIERLAHFKATYKISFADSFVLALATSLNASVITSDHHEFDAIEKSGEVQFTWIR